MKLKPQEIKRLQQFVKLRKKIITLQRNHYILNLRVGRLLLIKVLSKKPQRKSWFQDASKFFLQIRSKQDILNIKETRNDELKNRADNLRYQNTKMKAVTDRLEHNLAELLDKVKQSETSLGEKEVETEIEPEVDVVEADSSPNSHDRVDILFEIHAIKQLFSVFNFFIFWDVLHFRVSNSNGR